VESRTANGTTGGRYRIRGLLGEGGMARVFDAFDDRLERPVAGKLLRPETEALPGPERLESESVRLEALGAVRLSLHDDRGASCWTLADVEGKEFGVD